MIYFIGTPLGQALEKMILNKAFPDGLKPQEYERESGCNKLPVPYIHKEDEI